MHVVMISLFPDMFALLSQFSIMKRAIEQNLFHLHCINPRDFTNDKHLTVDDRPYGGGPGMVMMFEPVMKAIDAAKDWCREQGYTHTKVIYLSPQGVPFSQDTAHRFSVEENALIFLCGHYEGVDERIIEQAVDMECSIGDYVLTGGELAAMVVADSVVRLIPGVLGDGESASQDSFCDNLLDYPHYTRPRNIEGLEVPEVLCSGNHREIQRWRTMQALGKTYLKRPDLLAKRSLSESEQTLLTTFIEAHVAKNN